MPCARVRNEQKCDATKRKAVNMITKSQRVVIDACQTPRGSVSNGLLVIAYTVGYVPDPRY
jgi:hypothetical protein